MFEVISVILLVVLNSALFHFKWWKLAGAPNELLFADYCLILGGHIAITALTMCLLTFWKVILCVALIVAGAIFVHFALLAPMWQGMENLVKNCKIEVSFKKEEE